MYIHVCVHAHIYVHVHEKNQGGIRQASGPWTVAVSLLTLIGSEYCVEHHHIVCTSTMHMYTHVQCTCICRDMYNIMQL